MAQLPQEGAQAVGFCFYQFIYAVPPPRSVLLSLRSEVATGNPHPQEGAQAVGFCFLS